MKHRTIAVSLVLLSFTAHAADLSGTFVSEENRAVRLVLEQSADGSVSGHFASPSGSVAINAQRAGDELLGRMHGVDGTVELRLHARGNRIMVQFTSEPDGKPHPFRREPDLSGHYISEENPALRLELEQSADGSVFGDFSSSSGWVTVDARPAGQELRGRMQGVDGTFELRLRAEGDKILVHFTSEPDGKPHPFRREFKLDGDVVVVLPAEGPNGRGSQVIAMPNPEFPRPPPPRPTKVTVNGKRLSTAELEEIEQMHRLSIVPANYWYDPRTGAWGLKGGPTRGFIRPNIQFGGKLAADASGGRTRVFINGRELHPQDLSVLQSCLPTPVQRKRYWVGADGIGGDEGGPPLFNLVALCSQKREDAGPAGWQCSGGACGPAATRTGVSNSVTRPAGAAGSSDRAKWVMTP